MAKNKVKKNEQIVRPIPVQETFEPATPTFLKWDWAAFWIATIVTLGVYFYSLAPSVTLEDGGELAVAADYLGIPHPPGYPLWTIFGWVFARIFSFQHYLGNPNPAWSIALMSAVFGALATGLTAMLICVSGREMLRSIRKTSGDTEHSIDDLICLAGGITGSLMFAFSPVMWSQSNIVEVYSLNAFFVSLILLLSYAWMRRPSDRLLYAIALAFGLGLANWWPSVLLTFGPIVLVIFLKDTKLLRDFAAVGAVVFGMIALNVVLAKIRLTPDPLDPSKLLYPWAGKLLWSQGPYSNAFWSYFAINCAAIGLGWWLLPKGRTVAIVFILIELGVLVYLYMPLASDLRNPPMNWGYPRTWEGFMHAVTRGQYEQLVPTDIFSKAFVDQVGSYMSELRAQFTLPVALLGFLPFTGWSIQAGKRRVSALLPAVALAVFAVVLIALEAFGGPGSALRIHLPMKGEIHQLRIYILLIAPILGMLVLGFTALILGEIRDLVQKTIAPSTGWIEKILIGLAFLAAAAVLSVYEWNLTMLFMKTDPTLGKVVVASLIIMPIFLAGLVAWLMHGPLQLKFDVDQDSQKWIIVTFLAFFLMGIVMVIGANPKGDIQDMFIQRVKFITSHAMYAYWVGYGLILGLGFVHRLSRHCNPLAWAGIACIALMPIYPVVENAPFTENNFNRELIRVSGGADQRGHDFGWQFGNYQLRGAAAITNELKEGEPRLPNPNYPPEMGPDAVFFGGTDPGRFVPTYMIFSAKVRPDVFLITQNALADHTYMSVMRDLYGTNIWIPSVADNNKAFRTYAEQNPDRVNMTDGRVIVQGVDQVMAINGILCKMIHDHNKWKHSFYVEESYVIPWMYPYMEPHGLILKVNPEPLPSLSAEVVKNDTEFWAWYSRRLLRNDKFIYDAVARKTFSKLRSAIAGLYESRGMWAQAENAYLQSALLCPVSPEAHFRLANMYMNIGRPDDARRLMERYVHQDPNNTRAVDMVNQIVNRKDALQRRVALDAKLRSGTGTFNDISELARLLFQLGDRQAFVELARGVMNNTQAPPEVCLSVAGMFLETKMFGEMDGAIKNFLTRSPSNMPPEAYLKLMEEFYVKAQMWPQAGEMLEKYLEGRPFDVERRHELGAMYANTGNPDEAIKALQKALELGGEKERNNIRDDPRLGPIRSRPAFQRLLREAPARKETL